MTWRDVDVTWRAVADWSGRTYHPLMQFGRLSLARPESAFPPPYTQEPQVGCLSSDHCHLLFAALASRTTTAETCSLGVWDGWGFGAAWAIFGGDSESAEFKARQQEVERFNTALEEVQQGVEDAPRFEHRPESTFWPRRPSLCLRAWSVTA